MKKIWIAVLLLAVVAILEIGAAIAGLNKYRSTFQSSSELYPINGYWSKSSTVTLAVDNRYPVGVSYLFTLKLDSANGATPSQIDFPLWKHWGVIGSYRLFVSDTATSFATTNDSVWARVALYKKSASGQSILFQTLSDSGTNGAYLGGATWRNYKDGEIDITVEQDWWERMMVDAIQTTTDANNADTLRLILELNLPYSGAYRTSPWFLRNEDER